MSPLLVLNLLSAAECDRVVALADNQPWHGALSGGYRENRISAAEAGLPITDDTEWIAAKLNIAFNGAKSRFRMDLAEQWDVRRDCTLYRYGANGFFGWHIDNVVMDDGVRKLAITVQLSDPASYDGGNLEFLPGGVLPLSRTRGAAVVFPAFLCHRISEITRGTRYSLAAGMLGPPFR